MWGKMCNIMYFIKKICYPGEKSSGFRYVEKVCIYEGLRTKKIKAILNLQMTAVFLDHSGAIIKAFH